MKKLFQAIRKNDLDTVEQLIEKKPELVFCTAKQPPKKDDGQSPLQVALKSGNFDIADYLLDHHADVNFMEADTCCNQWRAPAIHDAIIAAVMCSRWNINSELHDGIKVFSTREDADRAFQTLEKMFQSGADVNAVDSLGFSCAWRFCLQANQILPSYDHAAHKLSADRLMTPELVYDLSRIVQLLSEYGADWNYIPPSRPCTLKEQFKDEPLEQLISQYI